MCHFNLVVEELLHLDCKSIGEKYFLVDPLAQRVPQFLRALELVGAQPLVLVRQDFHEHVPGIRQVQQMLIWVTECKREQLALGVPAVEEQDDLSFFKDRHDFIEELAGKRQLRGFAVAHDVANRHRDITDLLLVCVLMEDRHAHRQADKGMAIEIGLAIVLGMVVQDAYTVEMLAPLSNGRVIHTEQDRLLPQRLWHYGKRPQRQGLANGCIRDEAVAKSLVIAVQRCIRLLRQELPEQATHRRSRLQSQLSDEEPRQQMARRPRRSWEQRRKNRQESTNHGGLGV